MLVCAFLGTLLEVSTKDETAGPLAEIEEEEDSPVQQCISKHFYNKNRSICHIYHERLRHRSLSHKGSQ